MQVPGRSNVIHAKASSMRPQTLKKRAAVA